MFTTKLGFQDLNSILFSSEIVTEICGNPCESIHCHPGHSNPTNGHVVCNNGDRLGSLCTFTCRDGYSIDGSSTSVCKDDGDGDNEGMWSSPAPLCKQKGNPCDKLVVEDGDYTCSDGSNVGSSCTIKCPNGAPYPPNVVCQKSGSKSVWDLTSLRWNISKPCCSPQCPPTARADICFVLDSSFSIQSENWQAMLDFTTQLIQKFDMGNDDVRFSVLPFGIQPDRKSAILFKDYVANKDDLLEMVSILPYLASDGTFIERALTFAKNEIFTMQGGYRPGVRKFLIVITDGMSADPVLVISNELRSLGIQTYAVGVKSPFGRLYDEGELLEIAGRRDRLFTLKSGFSQLSQKSFIDSIEVEICGNPCEEISCKPVVAITRGRFSCTDGFSLNSVCSVECDEGYAVNGAETLTCLDDFDGDNQGIWSSPIPTCNHPELPCDDLTVRNGDYNCTDEFDFGSECDITCKSGSVYPVLASPELYCGNRTKPRMKPQWQTPANTWGNKMPCCSMPCPPFAHVDISIILDSSYSVKQENWEKMKNFTKSIVNMMSLDDDLTRFAIFSYGMFTDDDTQVLLGDYSKNKSGLLLAIDKMEWMESDGTFTGRALRHAIEVVFKAENGDRKHVDDVVIVVTDGQSCDSVGEVAQELRRKGIRVFAVGIQPKKGRSFNRTELLNVAGDESRLFVPRLGFDELDGNYFRNVMSAQICGNPCKQVICNPPHKAPPNGKVSCMMGNFVKSQCRFTCNEGFELKGSVTSTCEDDLDGDRLGKWSDPAPICRRLEPPCDDLAIFNGGKNCSDRYNVGSACRLWCERGKLFPANADVMTCVKVLDEETKEEKVQPQWDWPTSKWSLRKPCCYEFCSLRDVVFVLDSSSSIREKNWMRIKNFVQNVIRLSDAKNARTRFSVVSYGMFSDVESQILLGDFAGNTSALIQAVQAMQWLESDGTGTGKALGHVKNVVLKPSNGNRAAAGDVVIVITDGVSCDGVGKVSRQLRREGVETYAIGIHPPKGPGLNETQLLLISGSPDRLFVPSKGFESLDSYSVAISEEICGNPCREVLCPVLAPPANGAVACTNANHLYSVCSFTCDDGYSLEGEAATVCADDKSGDGVGFWRNPTPRCVPAGKPCRDLEVKDAVVQCTDGFNFSSKCRVLCQTGALYPQLDGNVTTCGNESLPRSLQIAPEWQAPQNKWRLTEPCCAESCPPRAYMDACFVLDSTFSVGSINWQIMLNFTKRIIQSFNMDDDEARFAVFNYGVHTSNASEILLSDYIQNKSGLLDALDQFDWLRADGTNTSHALRHARDAIFREELGDRGGVSNVLVVVTDGRSDDAIDEIAISLRSTGVKTFALGVHPPTRGTPLNRTELLLIAGSESRLFIPDTGFESLSDQDFIDTIGREICGNPCEEIICPDVRAPENGHVTCSAGNSLNSVCTFRCDDGFSLEGDRAASCINDFDNDALGTWTVDLPLCRPTISSPGE